MRVDTPSVATADTIEQLRQNVQTALRRLITQLNHYKQDAELSANFNRVTNVATPALQSDAVNLQYLNSRLKNLGPQAGSGSSNQASVIINQVLDERVWQDYGVVGLGL